MFVSTVSSLECRLQTLSPRFAEVIDYAISKETREVKNFGRRNLPYISRKWECSTLSSESLLNGWVISEL